MPDSRTEPGENVFKKHKYLCMAPFVHVHLSSLGDFTPCCEIFDPLGESDGATIESHWNSQAMADFRRAVLGNKPVSSCRKCYAKEAAGLPSRRMYFNTTYKKESERLVSMTDGRLAGNFKPIDFDLRFSNFCNFRCRSCWHGASSGWFKDATSLGNTQGPDAVITAGADRTKILEQVKQLLPETRCIYFAGGEPLLMEGHYQLLQELIQLGRADITLEYNTNLSHLQLENHSVLELWKQFSHINVGVSADGMQSTGELIRKGMKWEKFENNLTNIRAACPHVNLRLAITVSVLNIFHIPDFFQYAWQSLGFDVQNIHMNVLQEPEYYNIQILPHRMKRKVELKLSELAAMLPDDAEKESKSGTKINPSTSGGKDTIQNIIDFMYTGSCARQIPKFVEMTGKLDVLRNENTFVMIPELKPLQPLAMKMQNFWQKYFYSLLFLLENQLNKLTRPEP